MFANNALLEGGVRVRVWIREHIKDQKETKDTTWPLMANITAHVDQSNMEKRCSASFLVCCQSHMIQ